MEHAGGAQPVQVVEQRGEGEAVETSGQRAPRASRGLARLRLLRGHLDLGLAQLPADHAHQVRQGHGLGEQRHGVQALRSLLVLGGRGEVREQDHRHVAGGLRQLADRLENGEAVAPGEHEVEQDQVRGTVAHARESALAVVLGGDLVALGLQGAGHHLAELPVVVDAEEAGPHEPS